MSTIITNSELQKKIGSIAKNINNTTYTVVTRGKAKMVILPYFDDNDDVIADYLEAYEIQQNKNKLQQELQQSLNSGDSDFVI